MSEEPRGFWGKLGMITAFLTALGGLATLISRCMETESPPIPSYVPRQDTPSYIFPPISPDQQFGNIYIDTPPSFAPCMLNFHIDMAGRRIVPQPPRHLISNIPLGPTTWTIRGEVRCSDGSFCQSPGSQQSGIVTLRAGYTYVFRWWIVPGSPKGPECHFALVE